MKIDMQSGVDNLTLISSQPESPSSIWLDQSQAPDILSTPLNCDDNDDDADDNVTSCIFAKVTNGFSDVNKSGKQSPPKVTSRSHATLPYIDSTETFSSPKSMKGLLELTETRKKHMLHSARVEYLERRHVNDGDDDDDAKTRLATKRSSSSTLFDNAAQSDNNNNNNNANAKMIQRHFDDDRLSNKRFAPTSTTAAGSPRTTELYHCKLSKLFSGNSAHQRRKPQSSSSSSNASRHSQSSCSFPSPPHDDESRSDQEDEKEEEEEEEEEMNNTTLILNPSSAESTATSQNPLRMIASTLSSTSLSFNCHAAKVMLTMPTPPQEKYDEDNCCEHLFIDDNDALLWSPSSGGSNSLSNTPESPEQATPENIIQISGETSARMITCEKINRKNARTKQRKVSLRLSPRKRNQKSKLIIESNLSLPPKSTVAAETERDLNRNENAPGDEAAGKTIAKSLSIDSDCTIIETDEVDKQALTTLSSSASTTICVDDEAGDEAAPAAASTAASTVISLPRRYTRSVAKSRSDNRSKGYVRKKRNNNNRAIPRLVNPVPDPDARQFAYGPDNPLSTYAILRLQPHRRREPNQSNARLHSITVVWKPSWEIGAKTRWCPNLLRAYLANEPQPVTPRNEIMRQAGGSAVLRIMSHHAVGVDPRDWHYLLMWYPDSVDADQFGAFFYEYHYMFEQYIASHDHHQQQQQLTAQEIANIRREIETYRRSLQSSSDNNKKKMLKTMKQQQQQQQTNRKPVIEAVNAQKSRKSERIQNRQSSREASKIRGENREIELHHREDSKNSRNNKNNDNSANDEIESKTKNVSITNVSRKPFTNNEIRSNRSNIRRQRQRDKKVDKSKIENCESNPSIEQQQVTPQCANSKFVLKDDENNSHQPLLVSCTDKSLPESTAQIIEQDIAIAAAAGTDEIQTLPDEEDFRCKCEPPNSATNDNCIVCLALSVDNEDITANSTATTTTSVATAAAAAVASTSTSTSSSSSLRIAATSVPNEPIDSLIFSVIGEPEAFLSNLFG